MLLLAVDATAGGEEPGAGDLRLANGLRAVLRPLERARDVCLLVLFDVGGDHDPEGRSGLAHFVEHLYVTAAAGDRPARTAEELVRAYAPPKGWNAQTGDRYTVVATVFPPEDLEAEVAEAAARMGDLRITDADLERERPRILAELGNMYGGIPMLAAQNLARERIRPTPRGGRKGGTAEAIGAITREEADAWWRRHYKPRNALVVLAGAFDPAAAAEVLRARFGPLPAGEPVPAPGEPGAPRPGYEEVDARVPGEWIATACRAPDPSSPSYAAYVTVVKRFARRMGREQPPDGPRPWIALLDDPAVVGYVAPRTWQGVEWDVGAAVDDLLSVASFAGEGRGAAGGFPGVFLGTEALPGPRVPYFDAFGVGRRLQMGLDPVALRTRLESLAPQEIDRVAAEVFGRERRATVLVRAKAR